MATVLDLVRRYQDAIQRYPHDEEKLLHCIKRLQSLDVTVRHLEETGVGRTVNALRKEPNNVGNAARALVKEWKYMVAAEERSDPDDYSDAKHYNGHGSGGESDHGTQSRNSNNTSCVNGKESSSKRKHRSSEDEPDVKKSRHSDNDETYNRHKSNNDTESNDDSQSDQSDDQDSDSGSSECDVDEQVEEKQKIKTDNIEKQSHHQKTHKYEERKSESSSRSKVEHSKESSRHSSHKSLKDSSRHSDNERKSEKTQSNKSPTKQSRTEKEHSKEREGKSKHRSSSSKSESSSHKKDENGHKKSSEKETSKEKSKESNKSSKDNISSSNNSDKSKDKTSSKEKSSHKDGKHSSDKKCKSSESGRSKDKEQKSSSHSKSSHSSKIKTKSKDDIPKKKTTQGNEGEYEGGIDSGSGASFAEALGMISPVKSKKKPTPNIRDISSPLSSSSGDVHTASLLAPSTKLAPLPPLEISALPEISPNYRPRPAPKLLPHFSDDDAMNAVISSKNQRTKVYSGNKVMGKVYSLYELCVQVLQEHIDSLEYTGGVPYDILKPIVDRANPDQLFTLEHYNPYLMEDTDHLWEGFCKKRFRNKQRQEMETWRDMYIRCQEEQEYKLKSLTANIKMAQDAKNAPVKQTKMAYVDTVVKPPRNIARKQALHGTARAAAASPAARVASLSAAPNVIRAGIGRIAPVNAAPTSSGFQKPKKAPLMQKALQFMRGRKR